ncbi:MAG: prenyltransferase [Anaerolineae bacterium]|nr:prenyltransferase [Anaerolineae bacterium]
MYHFIRLGRPLFLAGGFALHTLGIVIALYSGASLNLSALLWGQIAITATQWMTHYGNDYFDLEADRTNQTPTLWSGGSRILPEGLLPPGVALITAVLLASIAIFAAFVLVFVVRTGPLTLPLFILSLTLAWFYSAPPIRFHSRGLGELTTAILVTGLTPLMGFYLQRGNLEVLPLLAIFPLACLQFCMLLGIEFPDASGDARAGKRTLVVRLGASRAAHLYMTVLLVAYLALPLLIAFGLPMRVALGMALMSPLALWQLWRVRCGDHLNPARWNRFMFFNVGLLIGSAVVQVVIFGLLLGMK